MVRIFLLLVVLVLIAGFPFFSDWYHKSQGRGSLGTTSKAQIEEVVADYIDKNPQKMLDSVAKYQASQFEQEQNSRQEKFKKIFEENKSDVLDFNYPSIEGNSKVTVVEFFDSSCKYCKMIKDLMLSTIEKHKDVNYIFRNSPILGESSMLAAKYEQGLYMFLNETNEKNAFDIYKQFYSAVLASDGPNTDEKLLSIVGQVSVDKDSFKKYFDENSDKISGMVQNTLAIADKIGIRGVPTIIIGDHMLSRVDEEAIEEAITKAQNQ